MWPCLVDDFPSTDLAKKQLPINQSNHNPGSSKSSTKQPETNKNLSSNDGVVLKHTDLDSNSTKKQSTTTNTQNKSFAQAVSNICDIPQSQLPQPVLKGDNFAIEIPEEEYEAGMDTCKFNLHARIIWPKGATPLTVFALRTKLSSLWKGLSKWGVSFLGKGFYEFIFSNLEDLKRVRSSASWNLNPGVLKLFTWTRDFCTSYQNSTSAQVWVRIYGLPQEYWRPKILFAIANSAGTPICTDAASTKPMMERTFGQFARVLVDMDVTQELRYKVLVERKGYAFFVDLDYENIPDFCDYCKKIGHHVSACKNLHKPEAADVGTSKKPFKQAAKFVQVRDGNKNQGSKKDGPIEVDAEKSQKKDDLEVVVKKAAPAYNSNKDEIRHVNRFQALINVPDDSVRSAMREEDMELELEVNNELQNSGAEADYTNNEENDNSQDSEFVEATQNLDECQDSYSTEDDIEDDALDPEEIARRNKVSWANIMENKEAEHRLLKDIEEADTLEQPANIEEFQVVTSKKTKKIHVPLKNVYSTRGKSGSSKPFR